MPQFALVSAGTCGNIPLIKTKGPCCIALMELRHPTAKTNGTRLRAQGAGSGTPHTQRGVSRPTQWAGLVTKGWVYAGGSNLLSARRVEGNYSLLYKLNKENN
ncbi:UNVERIFIED_CONTAM: hypothetical protein FKN15_041953 [Acipenser sinensis]